MMEKEDKKFVFSNRTYDILKWVALVGTNAFSALIISFSAKKIRLKKGYENPFLYAIKRV